MMASYINNLVKSDASEEGDLQIYRAQMWQSGNYRCCYATAVSSTCASMSLDVIGVPGRVANVNFVIGTYELQWGVPSENGSPITAFIIEASAVPSVLVSSDSFLKHQTTELGDVPDFYQPDYTKFTKILEVEGVRNRAVLERYIKPYCQYRFRVTAVNDVGHGLPSHPSAVYNTREGKPITKVENITEHYGSPGDLSFQWKALDATDFGSSDAIWYRVTYTSMYSASSTDRERKVKNVEGFPLMNKLTIPRQELSANPSPNIRRKYAVSVQLENAYGPGPLSDQVEIYTLPLAPNEAPTNVYVVKDSGTSVRVLFTGIDLKFEDETFQGYIVEYWRYDLEDLDHVNSLYELSPGNRTDTRREEVYIYDLQPSMNYKFIVRAYNLAGQGPPSKQVAGETDDSYPSEAPTNVEAFAYSNEAVRVRWQPIRLRSGESPLDGYKVYYRKFGLPDNDTKIYDWRRRERDETEVLLYGLDSGERYVLEVQAYNRGGFGPRSDPVLFLMRYTTFNELWQDGSFELQARSAMIVLTVLFSFHLNFF